MNKSKFLKKSLAAILSVLLVVAMIPLSAAASETVLPDLTRIYVNDKEISVSGTEFSANYPEDGGKSVNVRATLPTDTLLYAFTKPNDESLTGTAITGSNVSLDIERYYPDGVVYLKLIDGTTGGSALNRPAKWYTLKLTKVDLSDESGVAGVKVNDTGKNYGLLNATVDQASNTINVEAAYGYAGSGQIEITPTAGATVSSPVTVPAAGTTFTVTAGEINRNWTVKVTKAPALLDFTVAGKQGVISDTNGDGEDDTITVTLALSDIQDQWGDDLSPMALKTEFSTITNTSVDIAASNSYSAAKKSGDKFTFTGLTASDPYTGYVMTKTGSNGTAKVYDLTVKVPKSTGTAISYVAVNSIDATIDGNNISATLDSTTSDAEMPLRLHVSKGATVTPGVSSTDWTVTTTNADYDVWETAGSYSGHNSVTAATPDTKKTFVVTAADTSYSTQYSIWWTKASGQTEATLTAFNLKKGDNVYVGDINEGKRQVTVEVPYMTTSISGWKILAAYSAGARGTYNNNGTDSPIMSNISTVSAATTNANGGLAASTNGDTQTLKDFVKVHSQGTTPVTKEYDLVVKFKAPNNGKKIDSMTVTVQNKYVNGTSAPEKTKKQLVRAMKDSNTYQASITQPKFDATNKTSELGVIKIKTAYSQRVDVADLIAPISKVTASGGVARLYSIDTSGDKRFISFDVLDETVDTAITTNYTNNLYHGKGAKWATDLTYSTGTWYVAAVPEEIAKRVSTNKITDSTDVDKCALYKVVLDHEEAVKDGLLNSMTIAGVPMSIRPASQGDAGRIVGKIPYSATVDNVGTTTADATNGKFVEFDITKYATLGKIDTTNKPTTTFVSAGDADGDGEADSDAPKAANAKLLFVRSTSVDHGVDVYIADGSNANTLDSTNITELGVYAEAYQDGNAPTNKYTFELEYLDPNSEAVISGFSLDSYAGSVSGKTINVTVPQGTNLKAMKASYTASSGAGVYLDDPTTNLNPTKITSGKTVVNASTSFKVYIKSEDASATDVYTVNVTLGELFIDVSKGDWFYDYVIEAALNKWIQGTSENTFSPYTTMTRGQFATIIARIDLGADALESYTNESRFDDVPSTSAYSQGIAYCADMNYINGVGNNNFAPSSPITREQAATILCRVKGISPISGTTSYADDASISEWAKGYVKAATAEKIFEGDGTNFNPKRNLKRCEGAKILVVSANK